MIGFILLAESTTGWLNIPSSPISFLPQKERLQSALLSPLHQQEFVQFIKVFSLQQSLCDVLLAEEGAKMKEP